MTCKGYGSAVLRRRLLEGFDLFGGMEEYVRSGDRVFVKPNFISPPRGPGDPSITDPALLYSLCEILKDFGARPILGDSPAFGTVQKVLRKSGWEEKFRRLGVEVVHIRKSVTVRRRIGGEEKAFTISRDVYESDVLINVPKLKVHCQLVMSLAIKNNFGCVPGKRKAMRHMTLGGKEDTFARMLVETYAAVSPDFTILDGIVAMERHGPSGGDPVPLGILFFGEDCTAIERVVAEVVGVDPYELPIFRAAAEMETGEHSLEKIGILGRPLADIGRRELVASDRAPIRFSPLRVVRSVIKNLWISRVRKAG